jgi:hypothetical protein
MYLWSFDGVSFLDESTMYDISFQRHELRIPEISRLIDQSIDGGIHVPFNNRLLRARRLCVARELLLVFHGSFLPEHQHQHDKHHLLVHCNTPPSSQQGLSHRVRSGTDTRSSASGRSILAVLRPSPSHHWLAGGDRPDGIGRYRVAQDKSVPRAKREYRPKR